MFLPAPDESIWVGVLRLSLLIPGARSLKDKRRVVAQLRDRVKARHHLHAAEVGSLDDHGRAVMALSIVSNEAAAARSFLDRLTHEIGGFSDGLIESATIEILRPFGDLTP